MSQPSIGRHIGELERLLDTQLFRRGPRGQELSERGLDLLSDVRRMGDAADALSRIALWPFPKPGRHREGNRQ
jgi:DNA-binding transcriptional LysR family regulator